MWMYIRFFFIKENSVRVSKHIKKNVLCPWTLSITIKFFENICVGVWVRLNSFNKLVTMAHTAVYFEHSTFFHIQLFLIHIEHMQTRQKTTRHECNQPKYHSTYSILRLITRNYWTIFHCFCLYSFSFVMNYLIIA